MSMPRWPATTLGYMSRSNKERSRRYMQVLVPRSLCNHARLLEPELSMRDVAKEAVGLWIEMKRGAMNKTDLASLGRRQLRDVLAAIRLAETLNQVRAS